MDQLGVAPPACVSSTPAKADASTLHSSSFMPASLPTAGSGGDYLQRSFAPGESTMNDMARTNALADRNTIVDMSLRLARFVLCVVAALIFAFGFALLTSNKKTLTYVYENKLAVNETLSTKASSVVEDYNTLFGYILFAGGKVFEVFCETLIFPTLATYLHNCSLYPGDQPARMHSVVKARCIFWGLKTVIILMNVGFTSVYVGQTTFEAGQSPRHLAVPDELTSMLTQMETPWAVDSNADVLHSILRTSLTSTTTPFAFEDTCKWPEQSNKDAAQQWGAWADDVDTTSASFSFPSHAWNAALLFSQAMVPTRSAEIPLRDYLVSSEKYAITDDWDIPVLYSTFKQSMTKLGLVTASASAVTPQSFDELVRAVASDLKAVLPDHTRVGDLVLSLEHRELVEVVQFTTLTVSLPVEANEMGTTLCGASGCVYATSTSILEQLHLQPSVSISSYEEDENSALVYSSANQFVQELTAAQTPHEVLTLSVGKLAWQLSPLHIRHDATCTDDAEQQCLGLSLPFATDDGVLLVGKEALTTQHLMHPVALVTLHPATIPDMTRPEIDALTSWHRLVSPNGMLVRSSSSKCTPLVDAYLTHLQANHFYLDSHLSDDMYPAALFYLVQRGVPTSFADAMSRRRLALSAAMASSGSGSGNVTNARATTDIEVNVPTATALVTVAGCIFIVLLMLCVIYLPTSRVKLSPDTTPAAQYVQILTDDLYPDLVHKKRLRFANGDCLLFNEYVVDAIVLHAKRDQTKKIYLTSGMATGTSAKSLPPTPLVIVTLALRDKISFANLPHVLSLVSTFLDDTVNIPLHKACATGSLALLDLAVLAIFDPSDTTVEVVEEAASTGQLEVLKFFLEKDSGHTQEQYEVGVGEVDGNGDDHQAIGESNGVTWGGKDMLLAAQNGHNAIVRWLQERTGRAQRGHGAVLMYSVLSGDLSLVQWLISRGFQARQDACLVDCAAEEGHLSLLQWLVEHGFAGNERWIQFPSKHLDVIKWLDETGLGNGAGEAFVEACGDGPLPVVWWLAEHVSANGVVLEPESAQAALESAAGAGRLEVVQWLLNHNIGNESTFAINAAASNGRLDVAKYLHSQGLLGCQREAFANAAKNGHLDVVEWLWSEFNEDPDADLLCVYGRKEFVSRAPPLTREMSEAASNGHLAVIQCLYKIALSLAGKKRKRGEESRHSSVIEMEYVVVEAARNGHLDVVQWVCTHTEVESTEDAMPCAASGGHFQVIKWLHENRSEYYGTDVIDEAAGLGNLSVLKWLLANRPDEGWSTHALDCAARGGHLSVLRWLVDHSALYNDDDDCNPTINAMTLALKGNHFDALLFVHKECSDWGSETTMLDDDVYYNEHMEAWLQEELGDMSEFD
ncbi:hypothetical protein C6341_g21617 [Phytophthora cactorum]|nr:hypothetical protein C6341_g21617 [Phytophthora cactorum]